MMRLSAIMFTTTAAMALAACGSESSSEFTNEDGSNGDYTINRETGEISSTIPTENGDVSLRSGAYVPLDLPAGFTIMPGAEIVSNTVVNQAQGKGALVTFRSDASPDEIADFYRREAEAAGITIQIETAINGGKMLGGENTANGTTFSVTAYPADTGTTGQLTIGEDLG